MNRAMLRRVLMVGAGGDGHVVRDGHGQCRLASLGWLLWLRAAGPSWVGPGTTTAITPAVGVAGAAPDCCDYGYYRPAYVPTYTSCYTPCY